MVAQLYGEAARRLIPGDGISDFVESALAQPEPYWDAVLATREHLAREHSFERRFAELAAILEDAGRTAGATTGSR
jgi:hypothetical protein